MLHACLAFCISPEHAFFFLWRAFVSGCMAGRVAWQASPPRVRAHGLLTLSPAAAAVQALATIFDLPSLPRAFILDLFFEGGGTELGQWTPSHAFLLPERLHISSLSSCAQAAGGHNSSPSQL